MHPLEAILALSLSVWLSFSPANVHAQTLQAFHPERRFTGRGYALCGSCFVPDGIGPTVHLAGDSEPGERIVITGTVFREDGATPDSGVTLFLYQADAGGYYHRPKENVFQPGILGWLRTGKDGRYEIHTVRPALEIQEPNAPAHIHAHVFADGIPEHFLHEFWFAGDPRIPSDDIESYSKLGAFSPIVSLKPGSDGILWGTRDIRVRPAPKWRYQKD